VWGFGVMEVDKSFYFWWSEFSRVYTEVMGSRWMELDGVIGGPEFF